jgi:hypothetical protein
VIRVSAQLSDRWRHPKHRNPLQSNLTSFYLNPLSLSLSLSLQDLASDGGDGGFVSTAWRLLRNLCRTRSRRLPSPGQLPITTPPRLHMLPAHTPRSPGGSVYYSPRFSAVSPGPSPLAVEDLSPLTEGAPPDFCPSFKTIFCRAVH